MKLCEQTKFLYYNLLPQLKHSIIFYCQIISMFWALPHSRNGQEIRMRPALIYAVGILQLTEIHNCNEMFSVLGMRFTGSAGFVHK